MVTRALDSAAGRLTAIRLVYLLGAALTLLWAPLTAAEARPGNVILHTFDRWDSGWFVRIVDHGYSTRQSAAFFPVYPLLVRGVTVVVRDTVLAGLLVSLAAAAAAVVILERIAARHLPAAGARTATLLFALYPLAFVFTAVYSDALFVLFVVAAVDAAERDRPLLAGVAGALAVDTRLLGLALVPTLVLILRRGGALRLAPVLLLPLALGLWMLYLHVHYGDALAFSHAEQRFWERRSPSPHALWREARTLEIALSNLFLHAHRSPDGYPPYVVVAAKTLGDLVCLVAAAVLSWMTWRRFGAAFGLFSWLTLAIVVAAPTVGQPLVSLPRFLLADFPLFLVLAALLEDRPRAREIVLVAFGAIGAAAAIGFAHGVGVA